MATEDIYSEFDRLSNLPESFLISNILSRLPLVDAVRSSLLARKWRNLWTKIPNLHFCRDLIKDGISIQSTMEHILTQHDAPLESFRFCFNEPNMFTTLDIHRCIHYAAKKTVEWMSLEVYSPIDLPLSLFSCSSLVGLKLARFIIPETPTPSEKFSLLSTRCLCEIPNLTDHGLQRLVELCPLLQKLVLIKCEELAQLKIQAPQLLRLKIRDCDSLVQLQINSYNSIELKIRDCYKLSILQLNSCVFLKEVGSLEGMSTEGHSIVESLRKLFIKECLSSSSPIFHMCMLKKRSTAVSALPFPTLFGTFPDLEELHVPSCVMAFALVRRQEQAALEMERVSDFIFPNLKYAYLVISPNISDEEVAVLGFLLRNAPSLKTLTLALPFCSEDFDKEELKKRLLSLERSSADVEIKLLVEEFKNLLSSVIGSSPDDEQEEDYYEKYDDPDRVSYVDLPKLDFSRYHYNDSLYEFDWEDDLE